MNAQCDDDFLFHRWAHDGHCVRCGSTFIFRGMRIAWTSVDDQSLAGVLGKARPVGHFALHDSRPAVVELASSSSEDSLEERAALLDLPAFLHRSSGDPVVAPLDPLDELLAELREEDPGYTAGG